MKTSTKWGLFVWIVLLSLVYVTHTEQIERREAKMDCDRAAKKCGYLISGQIACHNICRSGTIEDLKKAGESMCAASKSIYSEHNPNPLRWRSGW